MLFSREWLFFVLLLVGLFCLLVGWFFLLRLCPLFTAGREWFPRVFALHHQGAPDFSRQSNINLGNQTSQGKRGRYLGFCLRKGESWGGGGESVCVDYLSSYWVTLG